MDVMRRETRGFERVLTFRADVSLARELRALARRDDRPFSAWARRQLAAIAETHRQEVARDDR